MQNKMMEAAIKRAQEQIEKLLMDEESPVLKEIAKRVKDQTGEDITEDKDKLNQWLKESVSTLADLGEFLNQKDRENTDALE